ncbi:MAG: hypothetical protein IJR32_02880 [Paludibacteraceae bacterium]|nr:hypothetical protein [Paludibacteraceae bacterium]
MKHRLLEFLEYKGLGKTQFEKACGLSNGYINSMKHYIGPKKLDQILAAFPELNRVWLESGVGSMIKGGNMSNSGNMHFPDIDQLKKENEQLKSQLKDKDIIIEGLKKQLEDKDKLIAKQLDIISNITAK